MYKKIFLLAAALLLTSLLASSALALSDGTEIKNFTLNDLNGKSVSLEQFRGKTVVLNFWATWCPPCRAEMPEFNEMAREFEKAGEAVLLAVNMTDGRRETKAKVESFIKENGYSMTVLLDGDQQLAKYFGVRYIPTTFIIDGAGRLAGQIQGGTTKAAVMKLVREAKK
ncbi:MAG: TlpA disulfide reductase family protein [Synergistaceae bacterium]|nr:TlpA disulfide reductase family protein [Synergistaceae bacterium]